MRKVQQTQWALNWLSVAVPRKASQQPKLAEVTDVADVAVLHNILLRVSVWLRAICWVLPGRDNFGTESAWPAPSYVSILAISVGLHPEFPRGVAAGHVYGLLGIKALRLLQGVLVPCGMQMRVLSSLGAGRIGKAEQVLLR